jgi:Tol biopolymer transport system component
MQIIQQLRSRLIGTGFLPLALVVALAILFVCLVPLLRPLEGQDTDPAWSPDGKHIVFVCYRREHAEVDSNHRYNGPYTESGGRVLREICTIDLDTYQRTQLTDNHVPDDGPAWSPDGTRIVFSSRRDKPWGADLYVMNTDGSELTQAMSEHSTLKQYRGAPT